MAPDGSVTHWVRLLQQGHHEAAQPLWQRYFARLIGLAQKKLGGRSLAVADAEDVALSAFHSLCRGAERGRFPQLQDRDNLWKVLVVITARNVHNWMGQPGMLDKVFKDFHDVLKPGGVLAVEEHRSDPTRAQVPGASDGYVATDFVIATAEKAGFKLAAKSEINANAKDTKDHPFGVWTLPPVRRSPAADKPDPSFDRAKYDAIGAWREA